MNRKTFLMIVSATLLSAEENFCKQSFFENLSSIGNIEKIQNRVRVLLNDKNNTNIHKTLFELSLKPFKQDLLFDLIKAFEEDSNVNTKKTINPFLKNKDFWSTLMQTAIFINEEDKKKSLISFFKSNEQYSVFFLEPTYKNLMALKNIGYLNEVELTNFEMKIPSKNKDLYHIFYNIDKNGFNEKEIRGMDLKIKKMLSSCSNTGLLSKQKSIATFDTYLDLFVLSKIFPNKSSDIEEYFYAITEVKSLFPYLNYSYFFNKGLYENAAKNAQSFYQLEGAPEYFIRELINVYTLAAKSLLESRKYESAWNYSTIAVQLSLKIKNFTKEDIKYLIESKKVLKQSSKELMDNLLEKKDNKSIEKIYNTTNQLLQSIR